MIEKEFLDYVIECDSCSNYLNCDADEDFQEAIDMAKDKGWKIGKDGGGKWIDICPVCAEKKG